MLNKIQSFWLEHIQPKIVKFLLFVTKGEVLYVSIALVFSIVIVYWAISSQKGWSDVVELSTFSAVVLESALVAVVGIFRSFVQGITEDPEKLTNDYEKLVKRYSSEPNLIWTRNGNDSLSVFPVVHVAWLYDKKIVVEDCPENEYSLPKSIDEHYVELYNTHITSRIFNNTNIRVDDWYSDEAKHEFHIVTGRTTYYNSLVTNRALDYEIKKGITVRELLECGPMVHPLKYSKLSNHLGFNGFVETSDNKIIFIKRKKNVSIGKRTWGDSVGASLKVKYGLDVQSRFSEEGLYNAITREIEDELGIKVLSLKKNGDNQRVTLIAAYRDMLEGGKPQLLFYAKTSLKSKELKEEFAKNNKKSFCKKAYNRESAEQEMETDGFELYAMDRNELGECKIYPNKIVHKKKTMRMLPSASACVSMFLLYCKSQKDKKETMPSYEMSVLEQRIVGKKDDESKCEDGIYIGKRFVAVIDGVTSKSRNNHARKTPGCNAKEILTDAFEQLDNMAFKHTNTPQKVLSVLNESLEFEMKRQNITGEDERFKASVIYFDRMIKKVVSYGDCRCRIDDEVHDEIKIVDAELANNRATIIKEALNNGKQINDIRKNDIGREAILDRMRECYRYENKSDNEYGYPILNGKGINESMIKEYIVKEGQCVILCTDGYPKVCASLKESEVVLEKMLKDDPLLIGDNQCNFVSTKAWTKGDKSFDDRTWVKLG